MRQRLGHYRRRLRRRSSPSRRRRTLRVERLAIVDEAGTELIALEAVDGTALLRVGRPGEEASASIVLSAHPPIDDDPAMAGIHLVADGNAEQAWDVRSRARGRD